MGGYNPPTLPVQRYWYTYDANNRILILQGELNATTHQIEITKAQGAQLSYDAAGNRAAATQWEKTGATTSVLVTRAHTYDPSNLITLSTYTNTGITSAYKTTERKYDLQGRLIEYIDYGDDGGANAPRARSRRTIQYDADGRLQRQTCIRNLPRQGDSSKPEFLAA